MKEYEYGFLRETIGYRAYVMGLQAFFCGVLLIAVVVALALLGLPAGIVKAAILLLFLWQFLAVGCGVAGVVSVFVNTGGGIPIEDQLKFFRMFGRDLVTLPWRWRYED